MLRQVLARELMNSPVRQLTDRTTVRDAAAFLIRHGISGAPVIDDHNRWLGVFTLNDLARFVQQRILPRKDEPFPGLPDRFGRTPIRQLMSFGLFTVFPDSPLEDVVHALTAFKVHRVFVIEERSQALLGVITTMDLLRWMDLRHQKEKKIRHLKKA
jgi:CBS-domain-containing membrane protein